MPYAASWRWPPSASPPTLPRGELHDRAHLDATEPRAGEPCSPLDGLVQVLGFEHVETAEGLARLRERSVRGLGLAVADANRGGRGSRLERVAGQHHAGGLRIRGERVVGVHDFL